ncbi:MAG: DUF1330 domain-containing protein [Chloroflexota bacterium]
MTAYIIVDIEVTDPTGYEEYKKLAAPTVLHYGGRYIVRGGPHQTLESGWQPKRLVVLAFDSLERALAWHGSPEYAPAKALRDRYARSKMVVVEGA